MTLPMNALGDAFVWLNDPLNYEGSTGVPHLTYEHLYITGFSVLIAAVIALPLALVLGHIGRGGGLTVVVSNVSRAIPTLALLTIFAATPIGFGNRATIIALALAEYKRDNGGYPETLSALSPKYLETLPQDGYTSQPLKYQRQDQGYLLYSQGPNGKDDKGQDRNANNDADDWAIRVPIPPEL